MRAYALSDLDFEGLRMNGDSDYDKRKRWQQVNMIGDPKEHLRLRTLNEDE
jgi:hypothetical protein